MYRNESTRILVSPGHVASALAACLMRGMVMVSPAYRPVSRIAPIGSGASLALLT